MSTDNSTSQRLSRVGQGVHQERIPGGYVTMTVPQIAMAWHLMVIGQITRRQMRVFFCAFELRERRRHAGEGTSPRYRLEEIRRLVGGGEVRSDLRHLGRIGLLQFSETAVDPATSIDQLTVPIPGFEAMLEQIDNRRRAVPVPRRLIRALAGGFGRGTTAVLLAVVLRALYWHRPTQTFRVDGRVPAAWVVSVFQISRRAVTDGVARLIELGWVERLDSDHWQTQRWGTRVQFQCPPVSVGEGGASVSSSSDLLPASCESGGGFATPIEKQASSPNGESKTTRRLTPQGDRSGVCVQTDSKKGGGRIRASRPWPRYDGPDLRDVRSEHLADTNHLLSLYSQACKAGLANDSEAGRLDFMALAERARAEGRRPGALFMWLLRQNKTAFIRQSDEEAAAARWRAYRHGPREEEGHRRPWGGEGDVPELTAEQRESDRVVCACLRAETKAFPAQVLANKIKGWSREQWDEAVDAQRRRQYHRMAIVGQMEAA